MKGILALLMFATLVGYVFLAMGLNFYSELRHTKWRPDLIWWLNGFEVVWVGCVIAAILIRWLP